MMYRHSTHCLKAGETCVSLQTADLSYVLRLLHFRQLSGLLGNKYWYFGHPKFTPLYPPQAGGRDFWVYSVCSIYNKCLASQPLSLPV